MNRKNIFITLLFCMGALLIVHAKIDETLQPKKSPDNKKPVERL